MKKYLLLTSAILLSALSLKAQTKTGVISNIKKGIASFYHDKFEGRKTATGEVFDNDKFTAASNTLKLGSYVKVTNLSNGEVVYVRINDRMNKSNTRVIDLASIAAKKLNFHQKGVAKVNVELISSSEGEQHILAQRAQRDASSNKL